MRSRPLRPDVPWRCGGAGPAPAAARPRRGGGRQLRGHGDNRAGTTSPGTEPGMITPGITPGTGGTGGTWRHRRHTAGPAPERPEGPGPPRRRRRRLLKAAAPAFRRRRFLLALGTSRPHSREFRPKIQPNPFPLSFWSNFLLVVCLSRRKELQNVLSWTGFTHRDDPVQLLALHRAPQGSTTNLRDVNYPQT